LIEKKSFLSKKKFFLYYEKWIEVTTSIHQLLIEKNIIELNKMIKIGVE